MHTILLNPQKNALYIPQNYQFDNFHTEKGQV